MIAAEDAARYRDALGCSLPLGLPAAFTAPGRPPVGSRVGATADRQPGWSCTDEVALGRLGRRPRSASPACSAPWRARTAWCAGESPHGTAVAKWCDVDVLRQLRRRSLAVLRREVEPVDPEAYARFVQAWHGIPGERRGLEALVGALGELQGAGVGRVASTLESSRRRRAWPRTARPTSTSCAPRATWCGSAPGWGSTTAGCGCTSSISCRCSPRRWSPSSDPTASCTSPIRAQLEQRGAASGTSSGRRRRARPTASCSVRCGTWSGRARRPTTRWPRCGRCSGRSAR